MREARNRFLAGGNGNGNGRPPFRRNLTLLAAVLVLIGLGIAFPGLLAFAELAARELRVFWWLILLLALGIWLAFFNHKKRD